MLRRLVVALAAALTFSLPLSHPPALFAQEPPPQRLYLPVLFQQPRPVLIAALHYDGIISGEPDEAFQLYNPNEVTVYLEGWQMRSGSRSVTFPPGSRIPARTTLWCGREAVAFGRSFGHPPSCEWAADTDPNVPNLIGTGLTFSNAGATVVLLRPDGTASDVLVYKAGAIPPEGGWRGPALYPYKPTSAFHEQGQVLYRKLKPMIYRWLDTRTAEPQGDTDTLADWASEPGDVLEGRRVRYAGWDLVSFLVPVRYTAGASLEVFVAPDNSYAALRDRLAAATRRITFLGYTFESAPLAQLIAERARAGVEVIMLLEGAPPGGVSDQQRWAVQQIAQAGAQIYYMRGDSGAGVHDRYANLHAKAWVIDYEFALIGSENPSPDSFPNDDKADGTTGRRGVYLGTNAPGVVDRVESIMAKTIVAYDLGGNFADIWPYDPADPDLGAPPTGFAPVFSSGGNVYPVRVSQPLTASGKFHFELCQAPEHALMADACLLGLVNRAGAGDTLLIQQLQEPPYWGPTTGTVESDPNPRLQAYITAARRGAKVRVLLDAFFDDLSSTRSNLRTQEYVAAVARAEGLDIEVRRGNPTGLGLHNKMVLAQIGGQGWAMVGSLNGGEASSKVNREVSLLVGSNQAYDYLAGMFWSDWGAVAAQSDSFHAPQVGVE